MNQNFYNSNSLGFDQTQPSHSPVIHQPPQEISIQEIEDLKQQYFDEMKRLINSEYRDEIKIDELKGNFNITPVLSTEEPDNSLSMRGEHLDTISATESDKVIKSSVEDLVLIPSEFEGIPDTMCDVHLVNNPTPLEAKDHFEIVINSNDDYSSSDDDYLYNENIEYVEASPHDSKLVSLDVAMIVIPEDEEIEDNNLHEKLLKEKINTFDDSLPELENFCFDLEEISSGNTTIHYNISLPDYEAFSFYDDHIFPPTDRSDFTHEEFADELAHIISPPEYDCFLFKVEPNSRDFTKDVVEYISPTKEPQVHNALPTHPNL
nr:hypothetical protein [Tanacetum cinerariifolium]